MAKARVSVLMPVRRPRLDWLRQAIDSVLSQTYGDFELIVVVDDATPLDDFLGTFNDQRIRQVHLSHMPGLPAALNRGLAEANGTLIARLDADDECEPQRLSEQLAMFEHDPRLVVAGSQLSIIDEQGRVFAQRHYPSTHEAIVRTMQIHNAIAHPSVMFRRDVVVDAGGYPPRPMEDYDLWCTLVRMGCRFGNHSDALVRYRYTEGITRGNVPRTIRATIEIKERHFGSDLTLRARLRILIERVLLLMPPSLVSRIFRWTQLPGR
jgi:glycosyltransferase involved in cell wall biosynthesis